MPSSHPQQLNEIIDLIILTDPQKLLDIGVGFGKYGFLSREYLEMWNSGNEYLQWTRQIDGIEAFEAYLTPLHDQVYSKIFHGDALQVLPTINERYDLILMIDVLEHFTFENGLKVLEQCRRCGRNILISVPRSMSVQGDVYGNPYETHKYNWGEKDLAFIQDKFFLPNDRSAIFYIGEDWQRISSIIKRRKTRKHLVNVLEFLRLKQVVKMVLKSK